MFFRINVYILKKSILFYCRCYIVDCRIYNVIIVFEKSSREVSPKRRTSKEPLCSKILGKANLNVVPKGFSFM